jgi:chromosomal replication initiator protein
MTTLATAEITGTERARIALIFAAVCESTGVSGESLLGRRRTARVAYARQIAMTLVREATGLSLIEIGGLFDRDHGTVIHAIKAVSRRCDSEDEAFHQRATLRQLTGIRKTADRAQD